MIEERPRKVHLYHDQEGATFGLLKTPFADTLCKKNSKVPAEYITTDPDKVTCKICRRDARFKMAQNMRFGKLFPRQATQLDVREKAPKHFREHIGRIRQWIDGFEAAGGKGPVDKDTLRQIQIWLEK